MIDTKNSFFIHGVINVAIPFSIITATSAWGLMIHGIFDLDAATDPFWYAVIMLFPLLILPVSCIAGIIRGSIYFKKYKNAQLCLSLSIIGLLIYIGKIVFCVWLGSMT